MRFIHNTLRVSLPAGVFVSALFWSGLAQAQPAAYESQVYSNFTENIDYSISFPTAGTHDYVPRVSFLGIKADTYHGLNEKFKIGLSLSWIYFSDEADGTFQVNQATVTGKRFTAVDAFPILFMGRFTPNENNRVMPYVEAGLGPMYGMRRGNIGVIGLDSSGWQFALAGEAGVAVFKNPGSYGVKLGARYVGGFGSDAIPAISYLSINIGLIAPF